jgi:hypothetical protein
VVVERPRCVGPVVETSGGGGLARRATTTSAVVDVLAIVAAAITAIAVFVVVLVPVVTGAVVSAIGWARRRGRRWLGRRGHSVGVEHRRSRRRPDTGHVNLLKVQIISDFEEVQKGRVALNDGAHVPETLVQALKDVEYEDPVFNVCVKVSQIISHDLELAAVLID